MTVQNPNPSAQDPAAWTYDDEIDLRQYIDTLINWWREILVITVLAAIATGTAAFFLGETDDPKYEASASAVIARVSSNVTLDERFQTTTDSTGGGTEAARRAALVNLVDSAAIAEAVIAELGDSLTPAQQNPARLLQQVKAELVPSTDNRTPSDVIRISVTAIDPEKAAAIANAWVRNYVEQVNAIYGQVPEELIASVQAELAVSEDEFDFAQRQLETFISESQIQPLNRKIEAEQALLNTLRQSRIDAELAVVQQDLKLRQALFGELAAAESQPALALLTEQTKQNVAAITAAYARQEQVAQLLSQARALEEQIQSGGDAAAASNSLALQLLKTEIFAPSSSVTVEAAAPKSGDNTSTTIVLPNSLQLNVETVSTPESAAEQLADVQGLIQALEGYQAQLDERIQELATRVDDEGAYQFLEQLSADSFTVSTLQTEQAVADASEADVTLPAAILQSYNNLFTTGALSELVQTADPENDALLARISELERSIQQLAAQLEAERARERQLTQKRDLAWNAYDTLSNKIVELNLERTASNSEVRIGAPAAPPAKPIEGQSPVMAAAIGGALGLLFGIFYAFLANYMGKQPFLRRRQTPAAA